MTPTPQTARTKTGSATRLVNGNVLIIDHDQAATRTLLEVLAQQSIRATVASDSQKTHNCLDKHRYDLVFSGTLSETGAWFSQWQQSLDLLKTIRAHSPEVPVIFLACMKAHTAHQLSECVVDALHMGFDDVLLKPLIKKKVLELINKSLPNHPVRTCAPADTADQSVENTLIGCSPKLIQTVNLAKRIATTSMPVLINGESGTGKELISYLIHQHSKRTQGPYIRVNCAALSDTLLESELFGHEKGAFTGAYTQRKGRFEMAHCGTLLLDEITETPLNFQAKLLRVLEQQDFERVGGNASIQVNVRIISTSNKNLLEEVAQGRFRQDLYYRLSGIRILLAPLRQRLDDLTDLIWHFINQYAHQSQRQITELDPCMMALFAKYHWPGNIRQLRNVVRTSLVLGSGPILSLADVSWLFDELQPVPQDNTPRPQDRVTDFQDLCGMPLEQVEKHAILNTLDQTSGNQAKAARILGISDRTLRSKIKRYREEDSLQPA
jgi:DNA-binding NtrC family response regulator